MRYRWRCGCRNRLPAVSVAAEVVLATVVGTFYLSWVAVAAVAAAGEAEAGLGGKAAQRGRGLHIRIL